MQTMNQTPALFKRTTKRIKRLDPLSLTQGQIQSLVSLLKENLMIEQLMLRDAQSTAARYWNFCNPADPDSKAYFNSLNWHRDVAKYHKEKIAKLNKLQNTLKKMR
jgi:hypothetical protein